MTIPTPHLDDLDDELTVREPLTVNRQAATRTQNDLLGDEMSLATGLDTGEGLARQEFARDADINVLLARFGVDTPSRIPTYGAEIDYTVDLQTALGSIEQARAAITAVPEELKGKYTDWRMLLNATETGEYQEDLKNLAIHKGAEARAAAREEAQAAELDAMRRRLKAEKDLKRAIEDAQVTPD